MTDVTVIADDLTGAADCGIAFALAGLPTFVSIGNAPAPDSAQIVSVDTDTRRLATGEATRRAGEAARDAYRRGTGGLYKKIDSTLRGHVAAELEATFRAAADLAGGSPIVLLAPAFPGTGRTTRAARVLVNGVPLEESEVWRKSGMTGPADLIPMLRGAGLQAESVALDAVRCSGATLASAFSDLSGRGVHVAVCDAEQEEDLRRIADAGAKLRQPVIWVGSGGLARHLPAALGLRPHQGRAARPRVGSGPVLTLVGSRSTIAREQARLLGAEQGVTTFVLDTDVLLGGAGRDRWQKSQADVRRALGAGQDVVLVTALGASVDLEIGPALAEGLGRFASECAERLGGLVATGGDIARAVLGALGAGGLHLLGEVEPGVPMGIADAKRPLPVVTKAGAFGTPQALSRCRAALKKLIGAAAPGAGSS
jgi:4-hydroxythreonine-4-phosphate dehydrogenase